MKDNNPQNCSMPDGAIKLKSIFLNLDKAEKMNEPYRTIALKRMIAAALDELKHVPEEE